jgi:hypothetical protein
MVLQCIDSFERWGVGWAPFSGVNGGGEEVWQSFLRRGEDGVWWPATVVIGGGVAR